MKKIIISLLLLLTPLTVLAVINFDTANIGDIVIKQDILDTDFDIEKVIATIGNQTKNDDILIQTFTFKTILYDDPRRLTGNDGTGKYNIAEIDVDFHVSKKDWNKCRSVSSVADCNQYFKDTIVNEIKFRLAEEQIKLQKMKIRIENEISDSGDFDQLSIIITNKDLE